MKLISAVYRSPRKEGMYLYVDKKENLERVPESLLKQFGQPEFAMTLLLTPERKLARAKAGEVIDAIHAEGFYLQMPPSDFERRSFLDKSSGLNETEGNDK